MLYTSPHDESPIHPPKESTPRPVFNPPPLTNPYAPTLLHVLAIQLECLLLM